MHNKLLLPNRFKKLGWCILILFVVSKVAGNYGLSPYEDFHFKVFAFVNEGFLEKTEYFKMIPMPGTEINRTLYGVMIILSLLLIGFSKEKIEDEFITNLRLSALIWAVWINSIFLALMFIFTYDAFFLLVMQFNIPLILLIYIVRFQYLIYKNTKIINPNN